MSTTYYRNTLLWVIFYLIAYQSIIAQAPLAMNASGNDFAFSPYSEQEILAQIQSLPDPLVAPHLDRVVKSYIHTYTVKNRDRTRKMLGRMEMYFPLFEKHLREAGMPSALKYVAVLESALDPMATSRSGAAGLWQIMPITAKDMKLRVSRYVDDRRDPERSTKAAIAYLKKMYTRFGSWELALAAYNSGPGRVSRIIRKTGISDFWKLKKHLPRETRNYVSAFIGANYIANYYHQYNLQPDYLDQRLLSTQTLLITQVLRFSEIAEIANLHVSVIQRLNARYPRGYIPEKSSGYPIELPALEAAIIKNRLGLIAGPSGMPSNHRQLVYEVQSTDNFMQLCSGLNCSPASLVNWNGLRDLQLEPGQLLTYFKPLPKRPTRKKYKIPAPLYSKSMLQPFAAIPQKANKPLTFVGVDFSIDSPTVSLNSRIQKIGKQKIYIVRAGESLRAIANNLEDLSLSQLMKLNNLRPSSRIYPGQHLIIK